MDDAQQNQPIAVFDSGLGGLTVVRHLRATLPAEDVVYFGDTARVPYGTKSPATVTLFALQAARFLLQHQPKLIVVACNSASAVALPTLRREIPVDVLGVIEPGAAAARSHAQGGVGILGTEATINSRAYLRALGALPDSTKIQSIACPLFVPIAEEDRPHDDPVVRAAIAGYLQPLRDADCRTVILGCTHYPLLAEPIAAFLGANVTIIDSGAETAKFVQSDLAARNVFRDIKNAGVLHCFASDNPERFRRISARFLNEPVDHVEQVSVEDLAELTIPKM